jgi:hypothetical protein
MPIRIKKPAYKIIKAGYYSIIEAYKNVRNRGDIVR